jgi:spore coat-associated protein N
VGILKRVIGLSIAGLLIACLAVGGTWAYSTDTETSTGNQLTAGTLDMVPTTSATNYTNLVAGGNGANGYATFTKMRPGQSGTITWTLVNNGSLPGTLTLPSTVTFTDGAAPTEIESAGPGTNDTVNGDLDAYVGVTLQRGAGTDQTNAEANFGYILGDASNYVPLSGLEAVLDAQSGAMAANGGNDTIVYKLSWAIASDVKGAGTDGKFGTGDDVDVNDSLIQGDTADIDITFTLTQ